MAASPHGKLDAILDEDGAGMQVDEGAEEPRLYAEHLARTRAEDAAADAVQRLTVAQVQLAEYAEERAAAAQASAAAARDALDAAAAAAAAPNAALAALCASLEEAAQEAAAFAAQQRADADRLKLSAEGGAPAAGVDGGPTAAAAAAAAAAAGGAGTGGRAAGPDGKRRSTAGGKRRSGGGAGGGGGGDGGGGGGHSNGGKRQAANGGEGGGGGGGGGVAAAAAAAGAAAGGGAPAAAAGDDSSSPSSEVHSACSNPTTTAATTTTTTSDDDDTDDNDAAALNGGGVPRAPRSGGGGGDLIARAQRALAAAADPHDALVTVRERARHVPLRLREGADRRLLRLLEAALGVSEYVDRVDVLTWRSRASRASAQIRDLCAILSGLVVAQDYRAGQRLVQGRDFAANAAFFQDAFEIGRRYKVMNPDKMRDTFGKLVYVLMDAQNPEVQELLEFPLVRPLQTVWSHLQSTVGDEAAAALLDDPLVPLATAEIPSGPTRARAEVQRDIRAKEKAREALARRHARPPALPAEDVLWCLYSIADNNAFLLFNRDPIDRLLRYFYAAFPQGQAPASPELSLAICAGKGGARLTHSHTRQWGFVQQSLTLWREVMHDVFRLYGLAEADMLRPGHGYRLADTGQGLNRVQGAPGVARAMAGIVARVQRRCGGWVGSSVVHMGDHNVPNALFFLDKYMQVPRILNPVVAVLDAIPPLCARDAAVRRYVVESFGGVETAQRLILADFCRHAFDGSGADSYFDAGSCIDGRLTAAWNWSDRLEKKAYAPLFRLCGWTGFDGSFR